VLLGSEEERLVLEVLRSGRLAQGPMVERLENGFRDLCGVREAVAVSNGTVALVAALESLGIGPGDEVVTSPFTFAASLNAILEVGATARFADIGEDFTIDPHAIQRAVGSRTVAIMPVHLYGLPARMDRISSIAEEHGLAIVEDAAQAHGASFAGRAVGSFGAGCFSLYATKNVTAGEGGVITTDDTGLADRLRVLRNQGMRERYRYEVPGHNYRMTELQAAVALPQLARLQEANQRRRQNAQRLTSGLDDVPGIRTPRPDPESTHAFHQYTVRVTEEAPWDRDRLSNGLARLGVESCVYYPRAVYDYDCYRSHAGVRIEAMPKAEAAGREVLSLPVHPGLSDEDLDRIVDAVRGLAQHSSSHVQG
jgi:dTDP-4-amino-4,6-dideoxygalactose transaminase